MKDIINILTHCEFAYHVEFGFIDLRLLNCITRCCKSHIVSKVGQKLADVAGSKTKSTDVFNSTIGLDLVN